MNGKADQHTNGFFFFKGEDEKNQISLRSRYRIKGGFSVASLSNSFNCQTNAEKESWCHQTTTGRNSFHFSRSPDTPNILEYSQLTRETKQHERKIRKPKKSQRRYGPEISSISARRRSGLERDGKTQKTSIKAVDVRKTQRQEARAQLHTSSRQKKYLSGSRRAWMDWDTV